MPAWVMDDDIWTKAKDAVDPAKYEGDAYWKVVTTVYQNMGGRVGSGKAESTRKRLDFLRDVDKRHLRHMTQNEVKSPEEEERRRRGFGSLDDIWPT